MNITLVTVGKIKERYFRDAVAEYQKRLSRYCKLDLIEVADEKTPDRLLHQNLSFQTLSKPLQNFALTYDTAHDYESENTGIESILRSMSIIF